MQWIFVSFGLLACGCAQVVSKGGFSAVQELFSATGEAATTQWQDDSEQAAAATEVVRKLLSQPLSPDAAVQVALLRNPDLQASYEELGVAQADLVQAGLLKNPVFSTAMFFGGVSPTLDFDVIQNFLDALLIPARERIAEAQFEQAKLRVAGVVFELAAQVRAAFRSLQGAEQLVDVLGAVLDSTEASRDYAAVLYAAGNLSELAVATEDALLEEVRGEFLHAQAATIEPREDLRELLGLSASQGEWGIAKGLPGLPGADPKLDELLELARTKRLELAAAIQEQAVVSEVLETAVFWRYFGGIELGAEAHKEQGERNWVAGPVLALEVPIFDQRQAEISRLEAQLRQAMRRAEGVEITVAADVRRAHAKLASARSLSEHYREALLPARRRVVALSQDFYNYMLLGAFELLSAKRSESTGYADYIAALREYWIAHAELERAVGARVPLGDSLASSGLPIRGEGPLHPAQPTPPHHGGGPAKGSAGMAAATASSVDHHQHGGH